MRSIPLWWMPSYSEYLCGAIIQEFKNHFDIEYSSRMTPSKFHYTDTRTFLKANGYRLKGDDKGFALFRDKDFVAEMKMGPFSAPFLNAWVGEAEHRVSQVAVGFDKIHPKDLQGSLARFSSRFSDELKEKKMVAEQADDAIIDIFLSDEIVTDGDNSIFKVDLKTIKALPRVDFESNGVVSFDDESEDEDSDSEDTIKAVKERKAPVPFYHVIAMEKRGKVLSKLPKIWQKKIEEDGLSWEFVDGKLYVSNTIGASYGLPPAPAHLWGLPKLQLSLDTWAKTGAVMESESKVDTPSTSDEKKDRPTGDEEWELITEQFMADPCWSTFETFKTAECIERAYGDIKDDKRYRMGSNKNPLTASIRKVIRGEENAISWTDFSSLLDKTARPNDTKGIMVLLYKFRLYVEQTKDGKVYVEK